MENAYDRLMDIKAFKPDDIEEGEKALLAKARSNMPSLPVEELDILVVDEIGKNHCRQRGGCSGACTEYLRLERT